MEQTIIVLTATSLFYMFNRSKLIQYMYSTNKIFWQRNSYCTDKRGLHWKSDMTHVFYAYIILYRGKLFTWYLLWKILSDTHHVFYEIHIFNPICTNVFSISKNRGGVQCARSTLNSSGDARSEVIVTKLAWNDPLEVIWWWAFDFFIYVNWKINNLDFLSGTQYSQKILIVP